MLKIGIHGDECDDPCSLYDPQSGGCDERSFWVLFATVGRQKPDTYAITPSFVEERDRDKAYVELVRVEDMKQSAQYVAVAGTVEIVSAPLDNDEWKKGKNLFAKIHAEFPEKALHEVECRDWGTVTETHSECTCEDDDGKRSTCIPESMTDTCCNDTKGPRIAFDLTIQADQCPWACIALAGTDLYRYCIEIQQ